MVVRNIPNDVLDRFKARAKAEGKSAEQLAREAIEKMAKVQREDLMRHMDELRARTKPGPEIDVVSEIHKARDRDRVWDVLNGERD